MYDFNVLPSNEGCLIEPQSLNAQHYCKGKSALLAEIDGVVQATNQYPIKVNPTDMANYLRYIGFTAYRVI